MMRQLMKVLITTGWPLVMLMGLSGCDSVDGHSNAPKKEVFVSADESPPGAGYDGAGYANGERVSISDDAEDADVSTDTDAGDAPNGDETVVEGDLYRVLDNGLILNLNSYRGLQVIDVADPATPSIVGRFPLRGTPVEMYALDNRAVLLFNHWQGYARGVGGMNVTPFSGGLVVTVDLTDPAAPKLISQEAVEGSILTSRMIQGENRNALYLAAWGSGGTLVQSFTLDATGALDPGSELLLEGDISDITATSTALLVARSVYGNSVHSLVSLIDISDENGQMTEASSVETAGVVQKKTDMSLYGNILRVVSGNDWSSDTNHLQTWDVTDRTAPVAVDHDTFGDDEQLYATLFLGNSAFFVTFFQTDPFHAFEIDDTGVATEHTEYVISGWNDFFKPAFDDTRLVGIGMGDDGLAVSLYNTALNAETPFIRRVELGANVFDSEATWDDRAFTVMDDAVSVLNADGVEETGLILLPYSHWDEQTYTYVSSVKLITFSADTLTLRGSMDNADMVRRSFLTAEDDVANMSERELNLFDMSNPDSPQLLGSVELAPWYSGYFALGQYAVRVKSSPDSYEKWRYCEGGKTGMESPVAPGALEVVVSGAGADTASVLASVEISPYAQVMFKGPLAVVISPSGACDNLWQIDTIDFSTPTAPVSLGSVVAELDGYEHYYGGGMFYDACYGPGCMGNDVVSNARLVGNALVIPTRMPHSEILETRHYCEKYLEDWQEEAIEGGWRYIWYSGSIRCEVAANGSRTCDGEIERCVEEYSEDQMDWSYDCQPVEPDPAKLIETCWYDDITRYWDSYVLNIVDLSEPTAPVVAAPIAMPEDQQAAGLVVNGNRLLVSHQMPYTAAADNRAYVQYFVRIVDLTTPASPVLSTPINTPGAVFAVSGNVLITRDAKYGDDGIVSTLNTVALQNGAAHMLGTRTFEQGRIDHIVVDGVGRAYVTLSDDSWGYEDMPYEEDMVGVADDRVMVDVDMASDVAIDYVDDYYFYGTPGTLQIINLETLTLDVLGTLELNDFASLQIVRENRALLSVPGGMLVVDVADAANPAPRAFYPTGGWDFTYTTVGTIAVVTAGPYGIYTFDLTADNLLQ
jgi:hypothetical protein